MTGIETIAIIMVALLLLGAFALAFGRDSRDSIDDVSERLTPIA